MPKARDHAETVIGPGRKVACRPITIVAAAIRYGLATIIVPPPARHDDIIRELVKAGMPTPIRGRQGFLTSIGQFAARKGAWVIAERAGQLLPRAPTGTRGTLFSEDLW